MNYNCSIQWLALACKPVYTRGMNPTSYSTWIEIDLGIIRQNIKLIQQLTGCPAMVIVKGNAYGHGALPVARAAVEAGVTWCGVSRLEEALALRRGGLSCHLMVLGYTPPEEIPSAMAHQISLAVYDLILVKKYLDYASTSPGQLKVHVKIETGMGRLGIPYQMGLEFTRFLADQPKLIVEGIFTHFARADEPTADTTRLQIERFETVLDELQSRGICPPLVHASNSAGAISFKKARYDLIRTGAAIYGLNPSPAVPLPDGFEPALTWKARLISIKELAEGHGVSYGSRYITRRAERIGVIPVGYADGYRRIDGQEVLINETRVRVVGSVCMDQCMVQLDDLPGAGLEDEVVLLGRQGRQLISAEELGKRWGTINYEVVCGLANRLPRIYPKSIRAS